MIVSHILVVINLYACICQSVRFDAMIPGVITHRHNSYRERQTFILHEKEGKERFLIKEMEDIIKPIPKLPTDPVDDSQSILKLVLMAQQRLSPTLRIPSVLCKEIHEYSDHNEIRTLFQMFTSPEDRLEVFGFASYEALHRVKQTKAAKAEYLQKWGIHQSMHRSRSCWGKMIMTVIFDDEDQFITDITMGICGFGTGVFDAVKKKKLIFNWDALADLVHLKELILSGLELVVSMDDIQKLPDSLRRLEINHNHWTTASGDVDLSLLPSGLINFSANSCRGMNGTLKLDAQHSSLTNLQVRETELKMQLNLEETLPSSLKTIGLPRFTDAAVIQLLYRKSTIAMTCAF